MSIYMASVIAHLENEVRTESQAREHELLSDILVNDDQVWLTHAADHWQVQHRGSLLSSLRQSAAFLGARLNSKREVTRERNLAGQPYQAEPTIDQRPKKAVS